MKKIKNYEYFLKVCNEFKMKMKMKILNEKNGNYDLYCHVKFK